MSKISLKVVKAMLEHRNRGYAGLKVRSFLHPQGFIFAVATLKAAEHELMAEGVGENEAEAMNDALDQFRQMCNSILTSVAESN